MKGRAPFLFLGLLVGFFSLSAQALLFREHLLAYAGNEIGIAVFLSAWMVWVALGGALGRLPRDTSRLAFRLPWELAVYPVALIGQLLLFWSLRRLSGAGATEPLPLAALVGWTVPLSAPVSLVTGFLFTRVARAREADVAEGAGVTSARLYGTEALGGVAGGLATTSAALGGVPVLTSVLALLTVWLAGACWFAFRSGSMRACGLHAAVAVALVAAFLGGGREAIDRQRFAALPVPPGLEVVESTDTAYQHVLVAAWGMSRSVFSNGELTATMPGDGEATEEAALLLSQVPEARNILVLGSGAESLVCQLLRVPGARVTQVAHDGRMVDITARHMPGELTSCLASAAVQPVVDDPRRFLAAGGPRFDLVVARFGDPRTAQAARFYTLEFFRLVKDSLVQKGVFSVSISTAENVLADAGLAYAASVHTTLAEAFERVVFTSGGQMTLFGAREMDVLTDDASRLDERFRPLRSYFPEVEPGFLATRFEKGRIDAIARAFLQAPGGAAATDESPSVFLLNLMVEYRTARLYEAFRSIRPRLLPGLFLALACLTAALLLGHGARRGGGNGGPSGTGGRWSGWSLIGLTGFSGMLGHIVLLLGYQIRFGSLLAEFGLLNALYMLGLFVGTLTAGRLRSACGGGRIFSMLALSALSAAIVLVFLLVGSGLAGAVNAVALRCLYLTVCLAAGGAAAWVIVAGSMSLEGVGMPVGGVAASIQVADNFGAVVGALGGGLIVLPASGLPGCALLAAALPCVPLVLALFGPSKGAPSARGLPAAPRLALRRLLLFSWLLLGAFGWLLPLLAPATSPGPSAVAASVDMTAAGRDPGGTGAAAGMVELSSAQVAPAMGGYGGPMDVVVALDPQERVTSVRLAHHQETPEYVWDLDEWMSGLLGKEAPLLRYGVPGDDNGVEALTGATVTARAVVDIVRVLGTHQRASRTGEIPAPPASGAAGERGREPEMASAEAQGRGRPLLALVRGILEPNAGWLLLSATVVGIALYVWGRRRPQLVFLGIVALLIGVGLNRQLALDHLALVAGGTLPPASHLALWIMLGVLLTVPVLGPVFCGYLCPLGAMTELVSLVGLRWTVSPALDRTLRQAKYLLASGLALALALGASRALLAFDPLSFAFRLEWDALAAAILALLLLASLVWYRPWCRYLCPLGACLSAGEAIAVARKPLPLRRSTECHLGVQVGRDWDCIRCNRCVSRQRPIPRWPRERWSHWGLVLVLLGLVALGGVRVAGRLDAQAAVASSPATAGALRRETESRSNEAERAPEPVAPSASGVPAALPPEEPRLQRKDNDPYPEQRRFDRPKVLEKIEDGSMSAHEADFYLLVP